MAFIHKETFKIYNDSMIGDNRLEDIDSFFECDDMIAPAISELNIKGYTTAWCCQGHPYNMFVDDIITAKLGETVKEQVPGKIHTIIPISKNTNYVFYEQEATAMSYIAFAGGVRLPKIPDGWIMEREVGEPLTIRKLYPIHVPQILFFKDLVKNMQDLYVYAVNLPPCTTSIDDQWNELISEDLIPKLGEISSPECTIIREGFNHGKDAEHILHDIVKFRAD